MHHSAMVTRPCACVRGACRLLGPSLSTQSRHAHRTGARPFRPSLTGCPANNDSVPVTGHSTQNVGAHFPGTGATGQSPQPRLRQGPRTLPQSTNSRPDRWIVVCRKSRDFARRWQMILQGPHNHPSRRAQSYCSQWLKALKCREFDCHARTPALFTETKGQIATCLGGETSQSTTHFLS